MTSTRGKWLGSSLTALVILVAPAGMSTVWAQGGGYGLDPFRPYNSQYDAYTFPMATPDGVGPGGVRMGNRGANEFQGYLDELAGSSRQGTERYGIGLPYYRSAVDATFDPKGKREYRPNGRANQTYEQSQEVITQKYLAYFTEQDPKRRAELLKDYNRTRSNVSRAMSGRRGDPTRALEAATANALGDRRSTASGRRADALPATDDEKPAAPSSGRRSTRALPTDANTRAGVGAIPPPPPLTPGVSNRAIGRRRRPSDVLDRARRLNLGDDDRLNSGAPAAPTSGRDRRPPPATTPLPE
jgi:hypothetical protein